MDHPDRPDLRSEPASHDPRSAHWRRDNMYSDAFRAAQDFHTERGYWPPGTGMRQREDEMADRFGRAADAHPGARGLRLHLRQELYGMRLDGTLLADSIDVRWLAGEAAYAISGHVLREDMPPTTGTVERSVRVTVAQVSPATWWDHFKLTYGHRWWLRALVRRRPVRTVERLQFRNVHVTATFDLDRYRLYPRASASIVRHLGEPVCVALPRPAIAFWDGDPSVDIL